MAIKYKRENKRIFLYFWPNFPLFFLKISIWNALIREGPTGGFHRKNTNITGQSLRRSKSPPQVIDLKATVQHESRLGALKFDLSPITYT